MNGLTNAVVPSPTVASVVATVSANDVFVQPSGSSSSGSVGGGFEPSTGGGSGGTSKSGNGAMGRMSMGMGMRGVVSVSVVGMGMFYLFV